MAPNFSLLNDVQPHGQPHRQRPRVRGDGGVNGLPYLRRPSGVYSPLMVFALPSRTGAVLLT